MPPWCVEYDSAVDPLTYVVSHNLHRRHLTESQRAAVAGKLANLAEGRPGEKTSSIELVSPAQVSQPDAAKLLNVSVASVKRAVTVQKQGVPELAEMVTNGQVKVGAAAIVAKLPEEKQKEAVAAGPAAVKAAAASPAPPPAEE